MKKIWLVCTIMISMGISSCVDNEKDLHQELPGEETNTSNFSTEQAIKTDINYSQAESKVKFYIYEQNPITIGENTMTLDESIKPLDAAWTDDQGRFTGELNLPSYLSDVYIVSPSAFATPLMKGKIENGILKVIDTDEQPMTRAKYNAPTGYDKNRFNNLGWQTNLGTFDQTTGKVDYAYKGNDPKLTLSESEFNQLSNTINKVLNTQGVCPEHYRTAADLYVEKENTAVVLTMLKGWTCWNSSLGYYYYKYGETPHSLKDVTVYAIFPNTQTSWNNGSSYQSNPRGVEERTAVQLKYYGDQQQPEGTNFPAGYCIGFVLACNSWNTYFNGFSSYNETKDFYASSTQGFSSKGANNLGVRTAMFKDSNDNIAITFEDFKDDQNFTDVMFALKANPVIINVPDVDPDYNTTIEKTGMYAFEDEWPKAKDYDMNDVMVQYNYQKVFNIYNEILQETFTFKTFSNYAIYQNGLAFTLKKADSKTIIESIKYNDTDQFETTQFTHEQGNVFKLTDNVKLNPNAVYKIVITYDKAQKKTSETSIDVFIFRNTSDNSRLEVHCPMQAPTAKADMSLFGTDDDHSEPSKGIYYVSNKNTIYPFAFYLSNATVNDIAPSLDSSNESKAISELYPDFIDWAKNGTHPDWYKKK